MAFAVELDDFSGGLNVGQRLPTQPDKTWTGKDVLVTSSGLLVPRRKALVGTGTATGNEALSGTEEAWLPAAGVQWSGGHHVLYMLSTSTPTYTVYQFTDNGSSFSYVRSFTVSGEMSERPIFNRNGGVEYARWIRYAAGSDRIETINLTAGGVLALTTLPSSCVPNTLCQWGSRLLAASTATTGRIYYSNAGDFSTWPSANYIDVNSTNTDDIVELIPTANALYIGRPSGWYVLTGTFTDMNALNVRPLEAGNGTGAFAFGTGTNIGGRILYAGNKPDAFLREITPAGGRDLAWSVEADEATDFNRRVPTLNGAVARQVEDSLVVNTSSLVFGSSSDGTGTFEMVAWRNGLFQRHVLDSTVDGIGGSVAVANCSPGADNYAAIRGIALRDSDNRVAPWKLPIVENRPVYWDGAAIEGVWRSAPIAGPRPGEPFRVSKVMVEVYKFKTSSESDSTGWGGSCSVKCKVWGEWGSDLSASNLGVPSTTELTWSQTASSIPDDWQREMLVFNVNDLPPVARCVVQLKLKMVAVRRVILVGEPIGQR